MTTACQGAVKYLYRNLLPIYFTILIFTNKLLYLAADVIYSLCNTDNMFSIIRWFANQLRPWSLLLTDLTLEIEKNFRIISNIFVLSQYHYFGENISSRIDSHLGLMQSKCQKYTKTLNWRLQVSKILLISGNYWQAIWTSSAKIYSWWILAHENRWVLAVGQVQVPMWFYRHAPNLVRQETTFHRTCVCSTWNKNFSFSLLFEK